jgi:hypothetical protein
MATRSVHGYNSCHLSIFFVWILYHEHGNSISCLNIEYVFQVLQSPKPKLN